MNRMKRLTILLTAVAASLAPSSVAAQTGDYSCANPTYPSHANTVFGYGWHSHAIMNAGHYANSSGTSIGGNKTIWPQGSSWRMAYAVWATHTGTAQTSESMTVYCRLWSNL